MFWIITFESGEKRTLSTVTLLRFYLFIFRQRGREEGREGEKHQCVVASHTPPTGDLVHNPGMYPDWELNRGPFSSQAGTQATEPHQPGPCTTTVMGVIMLRPRVVNHFMSAQTSVSSH